jgi:hypothetical protein
MPPVRARGASRKTADAVRDLIRNLRPQDPSIPNSVVPTRRFLFSCSPSPASVHAMDVPPAAPAPRQPWPSLWIIALASLVAQLALCQFFTFGQTVPFTIDVNPSNIWKYAYHFPPRGEFLTLNWFGLANLPPTLNPFSFAAAHLTPWLFFTAYAPLIGTAALLAMVAFLRELALPRPAALLGGVIYAWQGDLLPFVFPGHFAYITTWPFFALAAWAALRARGHWTYGLLAGASCGMMVGLQPDRGSIASLLIAAIYLAPAVFGRVPAARQLRPLVLCVATAALVSLAAFLALFQSYIVGVKLGGAGDREQAFTIATTFSLGPAETLSYLVPGFFGWTNTHPTGPYWGWIGQTPGYEFSHQGERNLNLAISTTGTVGSILAILGACLLLPGAQRFFGSQSPAAPRPFDWTAQPGLDPADSPSTPSAVLASPGRAPGTLRARTAPVSTLDDRQLLFGRLLLALGLLSLLLAWGYHTPLYRPLFALPLMDKWRNPLKWLEIFNFSAVTLAAYGAAQIFRSLREEGLRRALSLYLAVVVGLLFALLLASYPLAILIAGYLNAGYQAPEIANVMHTLHVSLGVAVALGVLLWLGVAGAWRGERLREWDIVNPWLRRQWHRLLAIENRAGTLAAFCSLLVFLQLGWVARQFIDPVGLGHLTATNPLLQSLKAEGPLVRVAVPQPQDSLLNFYLQNQFAADRISSIDISAASRIPDALTAFVDAFTGHTARLWTIGGVKNVAIAQGQLNTLRQDPEIAANITAADGYTLGPAPDGQPTHALVRLRDYFAKATFIPGAETFPADDPLLQRLADVKWNPRATVLLTTTGAGALQGPAIRDAAAAPPHPPYPAASITRDTPHEIDLTVDTPAPGYVLLNDQYDPDWQVTLNGKTAPLLRADYLLRAVAVPAGPSTVTLRYVAHYRIAPIGLSLPVILTNDFSDAVMLFAFLFPAITLGRRARQPTPVRR